MPSAVTYRWSWASWTMVLPRLDELRALEAMLSYKKAVYHLSRGLSGLRPDAPSGRPMNELGSQHPLRVETLFQMVRCACNDCLLMNFRMECVDGNRLNVVTVMKS